ncbi:MULTISPECIES: hypothetical protein [Clostridia]|uniref:hypothetical protein n=1 Tax=Clostridia TaxID=186801 RepID=UPI0012B38BA2|nr:hypothetical protein [Clostridium sp. WB02_MRS01]MSS10441.1 hypothetical protein [Clostridium sp. WB02_MRS01]
MRTIIKEQLLNLLDSMKQLQGSLSSISNKEQIIQMLADCQDAAIAIGEALERDSSDHELIVSLLEEYCEESFYLSELQEETISKEKTSILNNFTDRIKVLLTDIPSTYQVVFMPYKASMWDSLESIWRACREDERCECYVVPIPYYEFNSQANRWIYHYDGDQYSEEVPVVHYNDYSLEQSHPDLAYVHNPYDDCNLVTRVDSRFYSGELKRHVRKLVYVPYYITSGLVPKEHLAFPVYQHMDYMVAQSEYSKHSCTGMYYYDKILPFGSPKLDQVIRLCREGIIIPETWKPLLNGKKILMLNTSIGCFLQEGSVYLQKIKRLCEVISSHNQVALIWRPHPLLAATIRSMRPHLLAEYDSLKEYFIENKIGVLDETPDISRAVAISDAYIGEEGTSVIYLFGAAGKPIFILNNHITNAFMDEEKRKVHISDMVKLEDKIWLTTNRYNALFYADASINLVHYVGRVKEQLKWHSAYPFLTTIGKSIFLSPYFAGRPAVYDMNSQEMKLIGEEDIEEGAMRRCIIPYGNRIFYLPLIDDYIAELNSETGEWSYHTECMQELWKEVGKNEATKQGTIYGYAVSGKDMWLTATYTNRILRFNMEDGTYTIYSVGSMESGYSGIIVEERYLWLAEVNSGNVVRWDRRSGKVKTFPMPEGFRCWHNVMGRSLAHLSLIDMENWVVTVPGFSNCMVKLDKKTGKSSLLLEDFWKKAEEKANGYNPEFFLSCEFGAKIDRDVIIVQRHYDDATALIRVEDETYEMYYPALDEENFVKLTEGEDGFEKIEKKCGFFRRESKIFSFEGFVEDLINNRLGEVRGRQLEELSTLAANLDGTCGVKVHEYMMNVLENKE